MSLDPIKPIEFQGWVDKAPDSMLEITLQLTRRQIAALLQGSEEWLASCEELVNAPGHGIEEHHAYDAARQLHGELISRAERWVTWGRDQAIQ